jgi:hypothetical protein
LQNIRQPATVNLTKNEGRKKMKEGNGATATALQSCALCRRNAIHSGSFKNSLTQLKNP